MNSKSAEEEARTGVLGPRTSREMENFGNGSEAPPLHSTTGEDLAIAIKREKDRVAL